MGRPGPQTALAEPASERAQSPLRLDPDDPLMTAGEVALLLRVTKAWVYTQTRARRIPHVSLGRYVRYRRSAVLHWLDEIEQESVGGARW
jgi:excisionase family DNA binding protein